jgi:hypothetical protein
VILTPLLLPESAGFLYDGEKLTYAVTTDELCYMNEIDRRNLKGPLHTI